MKIFVAITFLVAVAECRRHLCDDGTRPVCPDGSKYFPPPVCSGEGAPACADGSEAMPRFNTCSPDEKKCPKGQGFGPHDKPQTACADGSKCSCPGSGRTASSTTRCAAMASPAVKHVRVVHHTVHGLPRTGTSMMES